jgi:hypothetical protein
MPRPRIRRSSGSPVTSSIVRKFASPSCSTEWIVTMLGWLRAASARASRRKRSRRSRSAATSEGRTLTATSRPREVSVALYTAPMPPRPISATMTYRPSASPGRSSWSMSLSRDQKSPASGRECGLLGKWQARGAWQGGDYNAANSSTPHGRGVNLGVRVRNPRGSISPRRLLCEACGRESSRSSRASNAASKTRRSGDPLA